MALGDKEYYMEEGDDKAVTYPYMDDLPLSWNKVELAVQSAPEPEERFGLLFNFMMYHSRWNDLHREDFIFRRDEARDPYKGFVMLEPQEPLQPRPASETVTQAVPLLEKTQYWLEEIIKLCQEEGIELWLIKSPSNLELEEKALLNTVEETARRYNVPFHDFNVDYADIGLDESMFFDAHHMDALGAGKFSRYFAHILQSARPNLKTDSGDPVWAADLEVYQRALEGM